MSDVQNVQQAAEAGQKKQVKRSLKKNVQPAEFNGPVKAPSGFFLYSTEVRPKVTDAIRAALKPDEKFNISLVAKKIGEQWNALSEDVKAPYQTKAKELKAKHDADLEKWKLSADYKAFTKASALHSKKKADKKALVTAKADGMPQRPLAGYLRFGNEVRDQVRADLEAKGEKYSLKAAAPLTKAKWEALGEEGKKPYHDAYAVAKAKYDEDMKAWEQTDAGKQFAKSKSSNASVAKRKQQNSKGPKAKRAKKDAAVEEESEDEEEVEESVELSGEEEESPEEE